MTIEEVLAHEEEFRYMLLGRLQHDCTAYIYTTYPNESRLWAGSVKEHIKYMRAIWSSFPAKGKPVWCTKEMIDGYEKTMKCKK